MAKKRSKKTGRPKAKELASSASHIFTSKKYEDVATFLLNTFAHHFGLDRVEGKQLVPGVETDWQIDAKGIREEDGGIMVVECRRYTKSKAKQEQMGGMAFKIGDTGAVGGIYVSPLGFQAGAKKIADAENIFDVRLTPDSTPEHFVIHFLGKFRAGASVPMFMKGEKAESDEKTDA